MDKCDNCGQTAECKDKCLCGKCGWHNCKDAGLFLIRLALAIVFIYHGYGKLANMEMTIGFFAKLGFPAILAWLVALGELGSGLAMLLGVLVRYAGILIAVIMLVAILKVKMAMGFGNGGYELDLVLLLTALGVSMLGGGKYSLMGDKMCCEGCQEKTEEKKA